MTTPPSFLIISLRFIGDVLLTTPLALSIKTALPEATIDYLVFKGTDKALTKNPHIRKIITVTRDQTNREVLLTLFKRYDVAIAAYPSDRSLIAAAVAGKKSIGLTYNSKMLWKKACLGNLIHCDDNIHVVSNMLSLLVPLGIQPIRSVVMGYDQADLEFTQGMLGNNRYILIHPYSIKHYKYWSAEQWGSLAALIHEQTNYIAVFTATPATEDNSFLDEIRMHSPSNILTLPCSLNQFAAALKNCTAYIGIDTAATHIAAALDAPTIALYGPSLTRYWAPWPNGCTDSSPFIANKGVQKVHNITVVQKDWECVPCNGESCAISRRNKMECLEAITPEEVLHEVLDCVNRTDSKRTV